MAPAATTGTQRLHARSTRMSMKTAQDPVTDEEVFQTLQWQGIPRFSKQITPQVMEETRAKIRQNRAEWDAKLTAADEAALEPDKRDARRAYAHLSDHAFEQKWQTELAPPLK